MQNSNSHRLRYFVNLKDVGSTENRTMTCKITGIDDPNMVRVDIISSVIGRNLQSGSGYTADISPMQLKGIINATQLTLIILMDQSSVWYSWSLHLHHTTAGHSAGPLGRSMGQNVYSATNGLKLMKQ